MSKNTGKALVSLGGAGAAVAGASAASASIGVVVLSAGAVLTALYIASFLFGSDSSKPEK